MKDKFMSNNMGQDLPIEGGVKLTQPGGAGVSVGGEYKPVRKQMSIQDFNTQFKQGDDFQLRKERALSNYYEGDISKLNLRADSGPIAIRNQEGMSQQLNKNDSTYFIDTNLYIADINNQELIVSNAESKKSLGRNAKRVHQQSHVLPQIKSARKDIFQELLLNPHSARNIGKSYRTIQRNQDDSQESQLKVGDITPNKISTISSEKNGRDYVDNS